MEEFRPMLAANADDAVLQFPYYASPKLDGIRCIVRNGNPVSRSLKLIPNRFVQAILSNSLLEGLDGELIVGDPTKEGAFLGTTSGIMSRSGEPDFSFFVFDDCTHPDAGWVHRIVDAVQRISELPDYLSRYVKVVGHHHIETKDYLDTYEAECLAEGYEGIMLRTADGRYKYGRSTANQQWLMKLKRFMDGEAEIIGFEELLHNANEAKTNALGLTERQGLKENMVPMGVLGALKVRDLETGVEFNIGTGFDMAMRAYIWENREAMLGQIVKYKFFPTGSKDKPRFPTFIGFRHPDDMS